ncbi:hypothetical protein S40293_00740 [Stachybotrys chartarum IBT 40293]|nr:hypothetical protein S40293_00740 [Stachybotrys chartarum IBT 40293]
MSKVMRSVKNVTKGYSSTQIKVREATSNDPWGPTGTQMSEIAQMTFNTSTEFYDIMDMIDKRLNDKGKNWRHVLKALKVLDYCLHEGSELVVTWARQSIYIIKTLREFQYIDEDGRDVGQNVRVAAKELTSLILDEERLRAERSDRKSWKSRVTGLEETPPASYGESSRGANRRELRERRPNATEEEDREYQLAIEISKQEEEDRKRRDGRQPARDDDDDDLAKAIQLSREEEERRRRELEETNASSLFGDEPVQTSQPQHTGFNQGYQQGNPVDFFANPIDQTQSPGYLTNNYTGFPQQQQQQQQPQQTGYANYNLGVQPGFGMNTGTGFGLDPYGQQQQAAQPFQPQQTGYNPWAQQQQQQQQQQLASPVSPEPAFQSGTNNPWAANQQQQQQALKPTPTGSNNPFAQFGRPQSARPTVSSLGSLPEQKTLSAFNQPQQQPQQQPQFSIPQREISEHESKLNSLLATGDGMDTYGNTGNLRIPAQHTAPGTFINSAGSGINRVNADATGSNPFMRQQFTGMPNISYGSQIPAATGPAGLNGQATNNPFGPKPPQQQAQNQDLIQF